MFFIGFGASSETVSQKEASRIAEQFFNESYGRVMQKPKLIWNGKRLTTNSLFSPFYVYNHPAGGYVAIAAENKAYPILFYSRKGSFDPERIDESERAILKGYAMDIEDIRYDSRIPYEAVEAWRDIRKSIYDILHSPVDVSESSASIKEAGESIESIMESDADEYFSDIYAPAQWEQLVGNQFSQTRSVKLGIAYNRKLIPAVINGRSGDYFRIKTAAEHAPFMRLSATEYLTPLMVADLIYTPPVEEAEEPDDAFKFYDDFVAETRAAEEMASAAYRMQLIESQPKVISNGGGHFQIKLPENVSLARVFNIAGSIVRERYFKYTDTATIDISADPSGFYVCLLVSESGKPYSFKLYR